MRKLFRRALCRPNKADNLITAGLSANSLTRVAAWLRRFADYVLSRAADADHDGFRKIMLACNDIALEFLAEVAQEDRGRTRVSAAARALNFFRALIKVRPLSADPRLAMLKRGVLRCNPHRPKGAWPFPLLMLVAIAMAWGESKVWWKRMVAAILLIAFLAVLRGAEVVSIPFKGVAWIDGPNESRFPRRIPDKRDGVLLLLPSRKCSQTQPTWVPLVDGRATKLLARHMRWKARFAPGNPFLFPSRRRQRAAGRDQWIPSNNAHISTASLIGRMRAALVEVCRISPQHAAKFTCHSLRVGGLNFYTRRGVSIGMRAQIASHKSYAVSRRYLRLLPAERIDELAHMVQP